VATDNAKYNGVYTIMDTGPKIQGRLLDIYMWSCYEALAFGRKPVDLTVLRLGWNPRATTPGLIDRLFRRREAARRAAPVLVDGATAQEAAAAPALGDGATAQEAAAPSHVAGPETTAEPAATAP
jgi:hypothetical protein